MTGYPADLLDLDLDLEADLGVDTVKQAEVFAAVREQFDVERDDNLRWGLPDPDPRGRLGPRQDRHPAHSRPGRCGDRAKLPPRRPRPPVAGVRRRLAAIDTLPRRVPLPAMRPPGRMRCRPAWSSAGARDPRRCSTRAASARPSSRSWSSAGADVLAVEAATPTEDLLAQVTEWTHEPVQRVSTGCHPWTTRARWATRSGGLARGAASTRGRAACDCSTRSSTPNRSSSPLLVWAASTAMTPRARPRRSAVRSSASRSRTSGAPRRPGQGGGLPGQPQDRRPGRHPGRGDTARPRLRRDRAHRRPALGRRPQRGPFPPADSPLPGAMELGTDSVFVITGAAGSIVSAITADLAALRAARSTCSI